MENEFAAAGASGQQIAIQNRSLMKFHWPEQREIVAAAAAQVINDHHLRAQASKVFRIDVIR